LRVFRHQGGLFHPEISEDQRAELFDELGAVGDSLVERYAWAIPDDRALRILRHFAPLVEIGAGSGYWAALLQAQGVNVIPFDAVVPEEGHTAVRRGGAEVLSTPEAAGRTLFLCYPDESGKLAQDCLNRFTGTTIVHVGELISDGTLSLEQAPWGRTSHKDFQVKLMSSFHCILRAQLHAYPTGRDSISVWRRSTTCPVWMPGDEDDDEQDDEEEGGEAAQCEVQWWRHIPKQERLPVDAAAPCCSHLL